MQRQPRPVVAIVLAVGALSVVSGCFGRPNPQLAKMEVTKGGDASVSFSYDDDGFLSGFERDSGGGFKTTVDLGWQDALLVSVTVKSDADEVKYALRYDDANRLEESTATSDGKTLSTATFGYDDSGRLEEIELIASNEEFGSSLTSTVEHSYDASGALKGVKSTQKVTSGDNVSTNTEDQSLTFDGSRLIKSGLESDASKTDATYSYDDAGRLEERVTTTANDGTDTENTTETGFAWGDDGLLAGWTTTTSTNGDETSATETELTYGDGEARGLDVTPANVGTFWDLKGGTWTGYDAKTQAARFVLTW